MSMASIIYRKLHRQPNKRLNYIQVRLASAATGLSSNEKSNQSNRKIDKLLIANRGEIACRIMRTAKRLGIQTVAVYSDADRHSLHVKSADEAVRIGPPPARSSYLNSSSIIEAAVRTGAQAIHPGYGFLSENADFAQLCENEGFTFVGPPASAIREMGDKSASKRIMGAAGVPLVPGYHGHEQDIDVMKSEADKIGYPVLIKPTHGGGGKGMRIVESPKEFVDAFLGAQREAAASFGVNTILLEKYITRPRHIEVQVFGDKQGNVVYLYERDCSVQRRHQKIIEEAPAPDIMSDFRSRLGQAAVSAAKAVGYHNAGTVEFIVDTLSGEFYFMEMNTRLQVEHPVTEMIVGQDLVEWQIRVANGESLPLGQSQIPISGHAFEARIYAENVARGFLPATGVLQYFRPVPVSETVRVETGVEEGDTVSMHYDPMIAKLVVWGENRAAALVKLKDSLSKFQVAGLPTNIEFLYKLANHKAFENSELETHFIDHFKDDLFVNPNDSVSAESAYDSAKHSAALVAACICEKEHTLLKKNPPGGLSVWYTHPPFRPNHQATRTIELDWENEYHDNNNSQNLTLSITYLPNGNYLIKTGENGLPDVEVTVTHLGEHDFRVEADGLSKNVNLACYFKDESEHIHIWHGLEHHQFKQKVGIDLLDNLESHQHRNRSHDSGSHPPGTVSAPMAGLVVKVLVKNGMKVEEGQPMLVMEAMKMEHVLKAPTSGLVSGLQVTPGQQVSDNTVLFNVKAV
ncbi:methylcrotonoyl-CoA carboxylase subunit alpha, mitochondrial [Lactuca sativa]|uniref:methylcrotonoyl-CoA carboxylase subunit alpha, mitochondrial n=1 Tax=Lactuca sativa TaxID=4236 RepID=UPI000CD913F5|nr:methylcrotonoyl-CoA carboxylase subunit alpha, mitochondrial [Lactuca sativa]